MTVATESRVVSVNVGTPSDVRWRDEVVRTAIWKAPVAGRRRVGRLNVEGDGQADLVGHGGEHRAMFVYQLESHRHWAEELDRDDLRPGHFGENLTVEGGDLGDDRVAVGDRFRIGTTLVEVTQPRVTCFKLGIRLDDSRMPALVVAHGRPGFYLRVLEEGEIAAGDAVVPVHRDPRRLTVREASALLYLPGRTPERLRTAISVPALSEGWRDSFSGLLDAGERPGGGNAGLAPPSDPPAWPGLRRFVVAGVRTETPEVRSFSLRPADGLPLPPARPGQSVSIRLPASDGTKLVRTYSLSAPAAPDGYRISVKREPRGAASGRLHDAVSVGDDIEVGAPRGDFTFDPESDSPVALVSAGVGVTPLLAMLAALAERRSERRVWWVHGARRGEEHAFADEARALLTRLPNATSHVQYSRPDPSDRRGVDFDAHGRLDGRALAELGVPAPAEVYICGPAGLMDEVASARAVLPGAGPVRSERFGPSARDEERPPPHSPRGPVGTGPRVSFARSAIHAPWDPAFGSLLGMAEACDVPASWSCRTGVCHRCEVGIVAGDVRYEPEPLDPPASGNVLICCARPESEVTLDL